MTDSQVNRPEYLLGDSDREIERLELQHHAWGEVSRAGWRRAGFGIGSTILDLGCGPGLATRELAFLTGPSGRVIAMDPSPRFLQRVSALAQSVGNVEVQSADAYQTQLEDNAVDHVHARWLFCFLDRPAAAAGEVSRVLRPGGTVVILDYFNYEAFSLAPRSSAMHAIVKAIRQFWLTHHGSLDIQEHTPSLLHQAGLEVVSIRNVAQTVTPKLPLWQWPKRFLGDYLPDLEAAGLLDSQTIDAFWADWETAENTDGAYLFLPPMIEVIAKKP